LALKQVGPGFLWFPGECSGEFPGFEKGSDPGLSAFPKNEKKIPFRVVFHWQKKIFFSLIFGEKTMLNFY